MYTFFHYENDGEKCLPPKMKSQWLFKMSHFHIEHPVLSREKKYIPRSKDIILIEFASDVNRSRSLDD